MKCIRIILLIIFCAVINCQYDRKKCSMSNCFDFDRCKTSNKVYIHPVEKRFEELPMSEVYKHILRFIRYSEYYTDNPNEACLFILGLDTTDRDVRSQNYVKNMLEYIESLDAIIWNNGRNHLIFNLYHGTFPDYDDHNLNFDTGEAMIARASSNQTNFFENFDISLPLFHDNHPFEAESVEPKAYERNHRYLISFKGKRYVYGIGSSTRNLVHHLHNNEDIIMVTTCKHNNDWQVYQDERCQHDNAQYDRWDYDELLANSTFCLVPRGRRLGSFRFLESLRSGCIPVVVSDSWVLPFSEVIDWSTAALVVPERNSLLIPEVLMSMPRRNVKQRGEASNRIYQKYLRSISVIGNWAVKIILNRIDQHFHRLP